MDCDPAKGLCKIHVAGLGVAAGSNAPKSQCSFPYLVSGQVLKGAVSEEEKPRPSLLPIDVQTRAQEPSVSLNQVEILAS